jgi:hypothetical protein
MEVYYDNWEENSWDNTKLNINNKEQNYNSIVLDTRVSGRKIDGSIVTISKRKETTNKKGKSTSPSKVNSNNNDAKSKNEIDKLNIESTNKSKSINNISKSPRISPKLTVAKPLIEKNLLYNKSKPIYTHFGVAERERSKRAADSLIFVKNKVTLHIFYIIQINN